MGRQTHDWKGELQDIINRHNDRHAVKAKGVSFATMHVRANFLFAFFAELRRNEERNYKVLPSGLGGRHVRFMVARWVRKGLAPGTIQVYLSYLRVFAGLDRQGRHGARAIRARSPTRAGGTHLLRRVRPQLVRSRR